MNSENIMGEYRTRVLNCIKTKLQEIEDEHKQLLEDLEIDFKKTTGIAWNENAVWFYPNPTHPIDKLPYLIKSKVDLVISSCLKENEENK